VEGVLLLAEDFTFVCPTEIAAFGNLSGEFADRDTQVLGGSTDSEFVHLAWRRDHSDLRVPFPMLVDVKREFSSALGILDPKASVAQCADRRTVSLQLAEGRTGSGGLSRGLKWKGFTVCFRIMRAT
jgi:alkyl hydroperoxide reductase subunit AhpC